MEKIMKLIYSSPVDFEIKKHHEDEVEDKIKNINMRRIKIFGRITVIIEVLLILFVDLPKVEENYSQYYILCHSLVLFFGLVIVSIAQNYNKYPEKKIYNYLPEITNFLFMFFMVIIGFLDQISLGNITSYISMLFVCGTVILIKPPKNYIIYTITHLFLFFLLLSNLPVNKLLLGSILNGTVFYVCMLAVSRYIYLNQYIHLMKNIILEEMNRKTKYLSNFDSLTNIANRRYFEELIKKGIENSSRFKSHSVIAIMDVDYFKKINDTYGHHMGDKVLVEISKTILQSLGDLNLVARWGGEEFIFFLPEKSLEEGEKLLNEIREKIENQIIEIKDKKLNVTASFGFTEFLGLSEDEYTKAFGLADEALYIAKTSGRNRVVYKGEK